MGVDYSAHYGIGVRVKIKKDLDCSFGEYLDKNLKCDYDFFESGDAFYMGGDNEYYVTIADSNKALYNAKEQKGLLFKELKRLNVCIIGEFGVVGGLEMY